MSFVSFFFRTLYVALMQPMIMALAQIWANKVRAMLTALGIIIGVGSVIAVVASLIGLKGFVLSEIETFGARKLWVWGYVPQELRTTMPWRDAMIKVEEAEQILEHCQSVDAITVQCDDRYNIEYRKILQPAVEVQGVWPTWHSIENRTVVRGRELSNIDNEEARQVCLINEKAIEELNLDSDPTGDTILIDKRRFLIIGVLETKEISPMFGGGESQSEVVIPYTTALKLNPYTWNIIIAQLADPKQADETREEIRFILRQSRNLGPDDLDTFNIEILQNAIEQFNAMAAGITMVAGGVVSVSLLVGGIGIMNIMLVSVSERTREIGLRKAVGARPAIVLTQFLVEAVMLCCVGGAIGVGMGFAFSEGVKRLPDSPLEHASVPPWAIALAFAFSVGTGVIFGMFPAIKAARLNPIEALRHE